MSVPVGPVTERSFTGTSRISLTDVGVGVAVGVGEVDLIPLHQVGKVPEDVVARGAGVPDPVPRNVGVGAGDPRVAGPDVVACPRRQAGLGGPLDHGNVRDAHRGNAQGHGGVRRHRRGSRGGRRSGRGLLFDRLWFLHGPLYLIRLLLGLRLVRRLGRALGDGLRRGLPRPDGLISPLGRVRISPGETSRARRQREHADGE